MSNENLLTHFIEILYLLLLQTEIIPVHKEVKLQCNCFKQYLKTQLEEQQQDWLK
jgi:hypothetical protein